MNHCISIGIVLSVFVVLLLSCGITASAAEAPVSGSSGAVLPAQTVNNKKTDAAEHIIISTDSATAGAASASSSASLLAQSKQAIVKVGTVGTLASGTTIGSLLTSVTYPVKGYGIASGGVSPSGVAARATTTLAANLETRGEVVLALLDAGGIMTGEFATLTFQVADGFLPNIGDFSIAPDVSSVTSVVGNAAIPSIEVVVLSLTLR